MNLIKEAQGFLDLLFTDIDRAAINLSENDLDHICYRTDSEQSYRDYKKKFEEIGQLLIESIVGGRLIATYKLFIPIEYNGRKIQIIEVPSPKKGKSVKQGFEHAEFVIKRSFEQFKSSYPLLDYDEKGLKKKFNKELMIRLENTNIKLHHLSLEEVIHIELGDL